MGQPPVLADSLRRTLERINQAPVLADFYLAGGTAVGLHLGHRTSRDLDFFSVSAHVDLDTVKFELMDVCGDVQVVSQSTTAISLLCGGTPVDFVRYAYRPIEPLQASPFGVLLAGLHDLAAMKLVALSRRGICRDFWDLFAILHHGFTLKECAQKPAPVARNKLPVNGFSIQRSLLTSQW